MVQEKVALCLAFTSTPLMCMKCGVLTEKKKKKKKTSTHHTSVIQKRMMRGGGLMMAFVMSIFMPYCMSNSLLFSI